MPSLVIWLLIQYQYTQGLVASGGFLKSCSILLACDLTEIEKIAINNSRNLKARFMIFVSLL
jgi:hypothetical protein